MRLRDLSNHASEQLRPCPYVDPSMCAYFEKIKKAACGKGPKDGGLSKKKVAEVMAWAYDKGVINWWCLYTTNPTRSNRKKLSSHRQLFVARSISGRTP